MLEEKSIEVKKDTQGKEYGVDNNCKVFTCDSSEVKAELEQYPELTLVAAIGNVVTKSNRGDYNLEKPVKKKVIKKPKEEEVVAVEESKEEV